MQKEKLKNNLEEKQKRIGYILDLGKFQFMLNQIYDSVVENNGIINNISISSVKDDAYTIDPQGHLNKEEVTDNKTRSLQKNVKNQKKQKTDDKQSEILYRVSYIDMSFSFISGAKDARLILHDIKNLPIVIVYRRISIKPLKGGNVHVEVKAGLYFKHTSVSYVSDI